MAEQEAKRAEGDRIEAVSIVTPNNSHYPIARGFLQSGVHIICDKPLTMDLAQALDLLALTRVGGQIFAVTYNYTGYPMVRQARAMVAGGELGAIRLVQVEHASGWASTLLEAEGHKQASWRTTPEMAGQSAVVADLGTHAHHLARFITDLEVSQLSAELSTLVPGRKMDDNAHILLHFDSGARGMMWVSMAATGHIHGQRIRVFGEKASLEWVQEQPNELTLRPASEPHQILSRASAYLAPAALRASRLWPGHPEGFLAAFANLYTDVADVIVARRDNARADDLAYLFPNIEDGVLGMKFIEAAVASHRRAGAWVDATVALHPTHT